MKASQIESAALSLSTQLHDTDNKDQRKPDKYHVVRIRRSQNTRTSGPNLRQNRGLTMLWDTQIALDKRKGQDAQLGHATRW